MNEAFALFAKQAVAAHTWTPCSTGWVTEISSLPKGSGTQMVLLPTGVSVPFQVFSPFYDGDGRFEPAELMGWKLVRDGKTFTIFNN